MSEATPIPLDEVTSRDIESMAHATGLTPEQIVSRAISLYVYCAEPLDRGELLMRKGNDIFRIIDTQ